MFVNYEYNFLVGNVHTFLFLSLEFFFLPSRSLILKMFSVTHTTTPQHLRMHSCTVRTVVCMFVNLFLNTSSEELIAMIILKEQCTYLNKFLLLFSTHCLLLYMILAGHTLKLLRPFETILGQQVFFPVLFLVHILSKLHLGSKRQTYFVFRIATRL